MNFVIEAIVKHLGDNPYFGGDYFKVMWNSNNNNVEEHMAALEKIGLRATSVKSYPVAFAEDIISGNDLQGNQLVVDGKVVHPER